jgi:acetyl-CoA carboxylase carboxyl transferase subunit alpha
MPADTLEFEEPVAVLLKEIEALSMLPQTPERQKSIESLRRRVDEVRADIYARLTPWQRVLVARHASRPTVLDYVNRLFTEFTEVAGDRRFADDHAIVTGFARYKGEPVLVVGHHKGSGGDTKDRVFGTLAMPSPKGIGRRCAP